MRMKHRAAELHAWLLLLPALVLLALFTHWPALETFIDSLHSTPRGRRAEAFVGIDNYRQMLEDPVFRQAIVNNLWYALGTIPTSIALALLVAIWKEAGFFMIFYLAALQQISPTLAEAAALEGTSRWTFFRRVQFPLLMPTTLFVLVNAVINAFRTVDHIVVMTRGGPDNASTLLLYYIYQVGFSFWDTTYAATLTIVMLLALAIVALGQYFLLDRRIHYR